MSLSDFLSKIGDVAFSAGAGGAGDWEAISSMKKDRENRSKLQQMQELFKGMVPQQGFSIDPSITADQAANIRYKSSLAQMAAIDPEKYGPAALSANSPDAELDSRLKALQLENAKNGGVMGDSVQAQVINSYIRMGIPPQKAMMMVMSPELVQQGNALANFDALHGLGGSSSPSKIPSVPSQPMPSALETIGAVNNLGGVSAAPSVTTPNMPATPEQMQHGVSQMTATTSNPTLLPQQTQGTPATEQNAAIEQKQAAAMNPVDFTPSYWQGTQAGQQAIMTARGQPDPQKYFDEQFKQAAETNKYAYEQPGKLSDMAKIEQENVQKVNATDSQLADIQARIDDVLNQPGINAIFGSVDAWTPDVLQSTANAASSLRSLADKTSLTALQIIRNNSPTGGAAGNMTEKEWPRFEKYFGNIDRAQSAEMAKNNLLQQKQAVIEYRNKLREAAGLPKIEETKDETNVIKFDENGNRVQSNSAAAKVRVYDPATGELK